MAECNNGPDCGNSTFIKGVMKDHYPWMQTWHCDPNTFELTPLAGQDWKPWDPSDDPPEIVAAALNATADNSTLAANSTANATDITTPINGTANGTDITTPLNSTANSTEITDALATDNSTDITAVPINGTDANSTDITAPVNSTDANATDVAAPVDGTAPTDTTSPANATDTETRTPVNATDTTAAPAPAAANASDKATHAKQAAAVNVGKPPGHKKLRTGKNNK